MAKLNIAVVGLGRIGWNQHCQALHAHKQFNLVAVCDPVAERCVEAEATFQCASYQDYKQTLKHPGLDAVVIATPTHLHKSQTVEAMKNGLHVILEKPMTLDVKEARAIIRASEKYKRVITVYQPHRLSPAYTAVQKLLKRRDLGKAYHIKLNWHRYVRRNDWQSMKKYGGGMLGNYGAHTIDFLLNITGTDFEQVFSSMNRVASIGDAEDVVDLVYKTKQGMIGQISINQGSLANPPRMEIYFTKGYACEDSDKGFQVTSIKGKLPPKKLVKSLASEGRKYPNDKVQTKTELLKYTPEMQRDFYKNFHQAVTKGKELFIKPEETLAVMQMMDRIRKQAD